MSASGSTRRVKGALQFAADVPILKLSITEIPPEFDLPEFDLATLKP
jgi:hypothetical protein